MDLEETISELVSLAGKESLSKAELTQARQLMRTLKGGGMSNLEISAISNGKWSESTVKGYTKGVKAKSPSQWQNIAQLLNDVINTGMGLDDLDTAVVIIEDLKERGVTLDDIVEILLTVDSASISLDILVQLAKTMKEGGLKPNDVTDTVEMKKQLAENGLSLDCMPTLVKLAKAHGEPQEIINAFSAYGSLSEIKKEVEVAQDKLGELKSNIDSLDQKAQQAEASLLELEKPLKAYEKVSAIGFDEEELGNLANLSANCGGHKAVLQSVELYTNYQEIKEQVEKAKSELSTLKTETGKLTTKYNHLKSSTDMCDSLLRKHKFSIDAIVTILSTAEKYGQPINVIKALDTYGSINLMLNKQYEAEGRVQETEKLLHQLEGQYQAALEQIESLNAITLKVGVEVNKLENKLASSKLAAKMISFVNSPSSASYVDYGHIVVVFADAILLWVRSNNHNFKSAFSIDTGLKSLITELGGD